MRSGMSLTFVFMLALVAFALDGGRSIDGVADSKRSCPEHYFPGQDLEIANLLNMVDHALFIGGGSARLDFPGLHSFHRKRERFRLKFRDFFDVVGEPWDEEAWENPLVDFIQSAPLLSDYLLIINTVIQYVEELVRQKINAIVGGCKVSDCELLHLELVSEFTDYGEKYGVTSLLKGRVLKSELRGADAVVLDMVAPDVISPPEVSVVPPQRRRDSMFFFLVRNGACFF